MGTGGAWYMVLDHTLQITLNRSFLQGLYRTGALSMFLTLHYLIAHQSNCYARCEAKLYDLNAPGSLRWSHKKTKFLIECFDPGILWKDFGIHADIKVNCGSSVLLKLSLICIMHQPFTQYFPCADIHELLLSDLLYQVIKWTFKDHIVTWVNEYLTLTHGESKAKEIIDDIDHQ